jgi:hypothetical protein
MSAPVIDIYRSTCSSNVLNRNLEWQQILRRASTFRDVPPGDFLLCYPFLRLACRFFSTSGTVKLVIWSAAGLVSDRALDVLIMTEKELRDGSSTPARLEISSVDTLPTLAEILKL